jgi:sigma-B regulation protein RsbU (phosphoserine phosphatase)
VDCPDSRKLTTNSFQFAAAVCDDLANCYQQSGWKFGPMTSFTISPSEFTRQPKDRLGIGGRDEACIIFPQECGPGQTDPEALRYRQELTSAASIQQRLMTVTIPLAPFVQLRGRSLACREIGGDFFDAVKTKDGVAIVLADVSGKGIAAALLASTLQGMINAQLANGLSLPAIAAATNRFFSEKNIGEKYATLVIARVRQDGSLEYVNCGHEPPLLMRNRVLTRLIQGNVPTGLLEDIVYERGHEQLSPGDRLILLTDGITEAENSQGEFFENKGLWEFVGQSECLDDIFAALHRFRGEIPLNDDCTVVELVYTGQP